MRRIGETSRLAPLPPSCFKMVPLPRSAIAVAEKLVGLVEQLPPDEHAADFGCAGADFVELGVAKEPPGREVVDVAVAAEALNRLERHPGGAFGGIQNRSEEHTSEL